MIDYFFEEKRGIVKMDNMSAEQNDMTIIDDLEKGKIDLNNYTENLGALEEGNIIKGKVIGVGKQEVFIDIGYKSEGIVSIEEFKNIRGEINIKIGDEVGVYLEKKEDQNGLVVISKRKADQFINWEKLQKSYESGESVEGKVVKQVQGGFIVDIMGISGFLPLSQIFSQPKETKEKDPTRQHIGEIIQLKILKLNIKKRNIVLSHRAFISETKEKNRAEAWKSLKEGEIREGTVKNITSYGAFVDIGGIDGLLHITDMSWGHVSHPAELLAIGDKIEVIVLKADKENNKISLGLKQKTKDPWGDIENKYQIGQTVQGKVVNLTDYGAFVQLEEGVEGLVHISEMSWTKRPKHPSQLLAIGDSVEVVILSIDKENKKLGLGIKQLEQDPWEALSEKYPVGVKIKGTVKSFADFGAFIELEDGIEGLLHLSDMSWVKKVNHPTEVLKKGEKMEVIVLKVDKEHKRISLGLKQLTPDPWLNEIPQKYAVGTVVSGKIVKIANFGVFVELENGIEGLVHVSELSLEPVEKIEDAIKLGEVKTMKVIKLDSEERKMGLSIRAYLEETSGK